MAKSGSPKAMGCRGNNALYGTVESTSSASGASYDTSTRARTMAGGPYFYCSSRDNCEDDCYAGRLVEDTAGLVNMGRLFVMRTAPCPFWGKFLGAVFFVRLVARLVIYLDITRTGRHQAGQGGARPFQAGRAVWFHSLRPPTAIGWWRVYSRFSRMCQVQPRQSISCMTA